jgi:hypothetical protein
MSLPVNGQYLAVGVVLALLSIITLRKLSRYGMRPADFPPGIYSKRMSVKTPIDKQQVHQRSQSSATSTKCQCRTSILSSHNGESNVRTALSFFRSSADDS